ncbi:MAG: hypothetical protein AAF518_23040 [Spirochaetota bacterium]
MKPCVIIFVILLVTCSVTGKTRKQIQQKSEEILYFTSFSATSTGSFQPAKYCLLQESRLLGTISWRAGDIPVVLQPGWKGKKPPLGEPVLLQASLEDNLLRALADLGTCDTKTFAGQEVRMMQIRSDWLPPENFSKFGSPDSWVPGLVKKEALQKTHFLYVKSLRAKHRFLSFSKQEKGLLVKIHNSFGRALPGLSLKLHYEGRRGKPVPLYLEKKIPALSPGASHELLVDTYYRKEEKYRKRSRTYHLQSVAVRKQMDWLVIDLQQSVLPILRK